MAEMFELLYLDGKQSKAEAIIHKAQELANSYGS
jgi:hypothetical protein